MGILAAGCGSGAPTSEGQPIPTVKTTKAPTPGGTPAPSGSRAPLLITPPLGADTLTLRDQDNGRTVGIIQGARLTVVLGSTAWAFQGSSNTAVVRPVGEPTVRPTGICPGGAGCGTATQIYEAVGPGQAQITASRTDCGEPRGCTPEQATYRVTIAVRI